MPPSQNYFKFSMQRSPIRAERFIEDDNDNIVNLLIYYYAAKT